MRGSRTTRTACRRRLRRRQIGTPMPRSIMSAPRLARAAAFRRLTCSEHVRWEAADFMKFLPWQFQRSRVKQVRGIDPFTGRVEGGSHLPLGSASAYRGDPMLQQVCAVPRHPLHAFERADSARMRARR